MIEGEILGTCISGGSKISGPGGWKDGVAICCGGEAMSEGPLEGKVRGLVLDMWDLSSPVGTWWC